MPETVRSAQGVKRKPSTVVDLGLSASGRNPRPGFLSPVVCFHVAPRNPVPTSEDRHGFCIKPKNPFKGPGFLSRNVVLRSIYTVACLYRLC